jgi:hypothetical protein
MSAKYASVNPLSARLNFAAEAHWVLVFCRLRSYGTRRPSDAENDKAQQGKFQGWGRASQLSAAAALFGLRALGDACRM